MPETFIIDEWLWSDLSGENGEEKQKIALFFIEKLFRKCDSIAVAKDSRFQEKEYSFSKSASNDVVKRGIARFYFAFIRSNSQKYKEINIEEEENKMDLTINLDDIYLIKTYNRTKASIITTDTKLKKELDARNIPCRLRDEFLTNYLNED